MYRQVYLILFSYANQDHKWSVFKEKIGDTVPIKVFKQELPYAFLINMFITSYYLSSLQKSYKIDLLCISLIIINK